ncbi:hypothetical protein [Nonomuraea glycinis]|uniref:hypothetical protein n=1 Tax=Nonomuraea glycinis TaxID=2047744 RepID=UPI002E104716|nr:hypothetical protein OHA68_08970 [Nonomuraea glycinis]
MPITRPLAVLATVAALVSIAPAAAQAATTPSDTVSASETARVWGPYYAPGKRAKTVGSLVAVGEDHGDLPTADTVKITGKLYDWTRDRSTCGWAVFRITYKANGNNLPHKHRSIRDCSYRTAKSYSFTHPDVYQVELKVCAEGRAAKPSLNCLYAGTWKTLYLSK